ncbi:Nudix hydrolase 20, chloroplastic, partial [Linum perenne]
IHLVTNLPLLGSGTSSAFPKFPASIELSPSAFSMAIISNRLLTRFGFSCYPSVGPTETFRSISIHTPPAGRTAFPLRSSTSQSHPSAPLSVSALEISRGFTWDDALRISQPDYINTPCDSFDLSGFIDKIEFCNRGSEMRSEFVPFVIEEKTVGYIHNGFVQNLTRFKEVFVIQKSISHGGRFGYYLTLHDQLETAEERTASVGEAIKCLGEEQLIPGIRNELYPVTSSFGGQVYFSLERAAAPYFGIKSYGIHMNGFVETGDEKLLWVAKRSEGKPTFPGMLDHIVAGGLPHGMSCQENVIKECEEEAGIPESISSKALPVGVVSYVDIDGDRFKRDVLFCYDLKLPETFVPENQDGEVEDFRLVPVGNVANIVRRTHLYKPNCSLVVIDFLFRHGYIRPESLGYLDVLQSLRSGDCS